jgi:hypothetical protein
VSEKKPLLYTDAAIVFMTIGSAAGCSLPVDLVEEIAASGGCERGDFFQKCLGQLIELGLVARCGDQVWIPIPRSKPVKLLRSEIEHELKELRK